MKSKSVDTLNIFLIILSLIIAFLIPFELFLMAYAILGPLHYLTEIRWLHEKKYFLADKMWGWIFVGFTILMSLNLIFKIPFITNVIEPNDRVFIEQQINYFIYPLPLIAFVFALCAVHVRKWQGIVISLVISIVLSLVTLYYVSPIGIMVGMLLPTIIHVFVFTLLFMVFGTLQTKNTSGIIAIILLCIVPLLIAYSSISIREFPISTTIIITFLDGRFDVVNTYLAELFGQPNDKKSIFYSIAGIKVQIFIAFAYTYHYLNWFSKTSVIGWSKNMNKRNLLFILCIWLLSMGLYWYDYKTGLTALFFLSFLHVFLELPLNAKSIESVFQYAVQRIKR